jgi:hypothetical protein
MKPKKNYQSLSDKLFKLYDDIEEGKIDVHKAKAMVQSASTINSIQRAKLISTTVTSTEKRVKFYED